MAWSTREIAELAGTTVNAVRHYHRAGLLDEPERHTNGYKQYGAQHLVSLLRIRRLADLGVPLSQIGDVQSGTDHATGALRDLDAELRANIARLTKARAEIAAILLEQSPAHPPDGIVSAAAKPSEVDSSMIHIYTQLHDKEALADVREAAEASSRDPSVDVSQLPPDADEKTRRPDPEAAGEESNDPSALRTPTLAEDLLQGSAGSIGGEAAASLPSVPSRSPVASPTRGRPSLRPHPGDRHE